MNGPQHTKQDHGSQSTQASEQFPGKRRKAGSGEGSGSAMHAMLKKRREGENRTAEHEPPQGDDGQMAGGNQPD